MKRWIVGGAVVVASGVVAPDASAQRGFVPPDCQLSKSHYLVNSAVLYLQNAAKRGVVADDRQRYLRDVNRVLHEALDKGRDQDPAVWYYLARYYEETKDLDGADSAFTRAQQLAPQCAGDIRNHRRQMWVPILNAGVDHIRAGDNEAAKAALRQANRFYDAEPPGFFYLGQVFATESQRDSSIYYFERALQLATDSLNDKNANYADIREIAPFNIATLFHLDQKPDSAVFWYRRHRESNPTDAKAIAELASALDLAGRRDEAVALYDTVLILADSLPTLDVFQCGVAMFRAGRLLRAAEAFEKGLTRNPYYRDALFNLANSYLSLAQDAESTVTKAELPKVERQYGERMTPVVERLIVVDPANGASLRLLAASYQLRDMPDSTLAALERREKLPFDVTVSRFAPSRENVWELSGVIANTKSQSTAVPPITFEFLSEKGDVVRAVTLDPQTIEPEGIAQFKVPAEGAGIAAWRYRLGT